MPTRNIDLIARMKIQESHHGLCFLTVDKGLGRNQVTKTKEFFVSIYTVDIDT